MHLSSILAGAVGFASIALAAPQLPQTTAKPTGCPYTKISHYAHGLTPVVREYSTYVTKSMTVDCHGCSEIVQETLFIKPGGGYTTKAAKTKTIKAPADAVGTKRVLVCRTGAPAAEKPAVQSKPMPKKLTWGKNALKEDAP